MAARDEEAARKPDDGAAEAQGKLAEESAREDLTLSFAQGRARAWLHEAHVVVEERQVETGWAITVEWTARQKAEFAKQGLG